jgi:Tol biopolymer transport system component
VSADLRGIALAVFAAIVPAPVSGKVRATAEDRPPGSIAFVREDGGRREAWTIRADGTEERALDRGSFDSYPAAAAKDGTLAILRAEDHGDVHQESLVVAGHVLAHARLVRNPVFTDDGGALVFESDQASFRDLYRVSRSGGDVTRLTTNDEGNYEPSLDARGMTFTSSRDGEAEIYRANEHGAGAVRLTRSPGDDLSPRSSPDGERIAFLSGRDGIDHLYVMNADGSQPRRVGTASADEEREHTWSSDGRRLAFVARAPHGKARVLVWDATKDTVSPISDGATTSDMPTFSPDGRWLAWVIDDGNGPDLVISRVERGKPRRITGVRAKRWRPVWLP